MSTIPSDSVLPYIPSDNFNIGLASTFALLFLISSIQLFRPPCDLWGLILPLGLALEAVGFFLRFKLARDLTSSTIFAVQYLILALAPLAFLAFNYIVFGRFLSGLQEGKITNNASPFLHKSKKSFSPIQPQHIKKIFVGSDICTFLIQVSCKMKLYDDGITKLIDFIS